MTRKIYGHESTLRKNSHDFVKNGKTDFIQDHCKGVGTMTVWFSSDGKRLGLTPDTSGNSQARSKVGVSGWNITKKMAGVRWILAEGRPGLSRIAWGHGQG